MELEPGMPIVGLNVVAEVLLVRDPVVGDDEKTDDEADPSLHLVQEKRPDLLVIQVRGEELESEQQRQKREGVHEVRNAFQSPEGELP